MSSLHRRTSGEGSVFPAFVGKWLHNHQAVRATCLTLGLCLAGSGALLVSPTAVGAALQVAQGTVYGTTNAAPNQTVNIVNTQTGLTRSAVVSSDGQFTINVVPSGTYTVTLIQDGKVIATQTGVEVIPGVGTAVNFAAQQTAQLGTISVTANTITPIDVTTSSTSVNIDATQVNKLPVDRTALSVALMAPTVLQNPQFGVPSFGGASSAENAFFVDGMNVTDDKDFLGLAQPPFEALNSFQVMTSGVSAAYGNALGGVLNMTTKSGSNDFHAGANAYWTPYTGNSPNVVVYQNGQPQAVIHNSDNSEGHYRYNLWASGAFIQDHLFYYALVQQTHDFFDTYGLSVSEHQEQNTPYGLVHLNWNINDNNLFSLTGWKTDGTLNGTEYNLVPNAQGALFSNDRALPALGSYKETNGSKALVGKYTWYLNNNFNLSAMLGYIRFDTGTDSANPNCPIAIDDTTGVPLHMGCWVNAVDIVSPQASDSRHEWRIDGEWLSGNGAGLASGHDLTFGYTYSKFGSDGIRHYPGPDQSYTTAQGLPSDVTVPGVSWEYFAVPASGIVNGVCYANGATPSPGCPAVAPGTNFVQGRSFYDHGYYFTKNTAWYLEDNWHLLPDLYIQLGVRNQGYKNYNELNQAFVTQNNEWAPRLGFSWNVNGDSTQKLYGSYARYYIPVANNTNIRAAGGELDVYNQTYAYTSIDPTTGAPLGLRGPLGPFSIQGSGTVPNPLTVATSNLVPLSEKEFVLGFQKSSGQWTFGVQAEHRWLVDGEDDQCWFLSAPPFKPDVADYAKSQGWNVNDFLSTLAPSTCLVSNPGQDIHTFANIDGATNPDGSLKLEPITIPNSFIQMPTAQRTYNAVTFTLTRSFSQDLSGGMSYTWSHLYGNEEGYVLTSIGQTDAGITESFDFPGLETGAYGDLANDHRHSFKFWGQWQMTSDWRLGANAYLQSGMPMDCLGTYPDPDNIAVFYGAFTHYCGTNPALQGAPGQSFPYGATLINQGTAGTTPWVYNINLQLAWTPSNINGLTVGVNWFNVLNSQKPLQLSPFYDDGNYNPIATYESPMVFQDPTSIELFARYQFF